MTNIVLAGFMATGKTTVGRQVARRLGWPFLDTDDMIAAAAGMSIPNIFASRGEAHFRSLERQMVAEAAARRDVVIAVGGGALLDPANRAALEATGRIVCLDADDADLLTRLSNPDTRPLLAGPNALARLRDLRAVRAAHYASLALHVDTSGRTVEEVAERVIALCQGQFADLAAAIPVHVPGAEYVVQVGTGLLERVGESLRHLGQIGRVAIVTQPPLAGLYGERLRESLQKAGLQASLVEIPDGEGSKTLATVSVLYDRFMALGLDRSSTIVALGGGVVGDVAGFAAATFLRGLPFVQVPTTLLAMVDASTGGKTGVDLPGGKNLVGAFHQPRAVFCDTDVLQTLPVVELRCGLAEAAKTGIIGDADLFALLESLTGPHPAWPLTEIVRRSVAVKAAIVAADPTEQGVRAHLNLGHTIGHAVEQASGYRCRHGEAVSIGLVGAARLAAKLGACAPDLAARAEALLQHLGLPVTYSSLDPQGVLSALQTDKKRLHGRLRWVLPRRLGEVFVSDAVPDELVTEVVADLSAGETPTSTRG